MSRNTIFPFSAAEETLEIATHETGSQFVLSSGSQAKENSTAIQMNGMRKQTKEKQDQTSANLAE